MYVCVGVGVRVCVRVCGGGECAWMCVGMCVWVCSPPPSFHLTLTLTLPINYAVPLQFCGPCFCIHCNGELKFLRPLFPYLWRCYILNFAALLFAFIALLQFKFGGPLFPLLRSCTDIWGAFFSHSLCFCSKKEMLPFFPLQHWVIALNYYVPSYPLLFCRI